DWFPWGPEAFEKAKKEKKLVFLSIGYSSCHWCHVMERESFADKEVADYLNKHFVCIKVDREERPDIDDIYMTALGVMEAGGGWPLSMFLTDDAKPIVGGTYWPKDDRKVGDREARGFKSILKYMVENQGKEKELREQADTIAKATEEALTRVTKGVALVELTRSLALEPAETIREAIDPKHGGIGQKSRRFEATKFPMPGSLAALLKTAVRQKDDELKALLTLTLTKMADGGIYDQLGGGFHRYSTERTWTVPHFEKMLYDNAQLVELYAEAYRIDPRPQYKRVVDETIRFVLREMTSPQGAFYSALDADSEGKEGEFYVWTAEEIEKALGDKADAALVRAVYGVSGSPNFEERAYVLKLGRPLAEVAKDQKLTEADLRAKLAPLQAKLLAAREKRPRPFLDTKVLTAWNGQMIAGLAVAAKTFNEPEYAKAAARAADFVLANMRTKDGRLYRTYGAGADGKPAAKLNAYVEDYAYLTHGLLCLHDATGDARWLTEAKAVTDAMTRWHGDGERGGYFFTSSDHEKLFARPKDYYDGVQPSGNSAAARNLVRLWRVTKDDTYRTAAEKTVKQFAGVMKANPQAVPVMAEVLHELLDTAPKGGDAKDEPKKEPAKTPKTENFVTGEARLGPPDKDGRRTITLTVKVQKPWHIYANPVQNDDLEGAASVVNVRAKVPDGDKKIAATVKYPAGKEVKGPDGKPYRVYEDEAVITATIDGKDVDGLEVRLTAMACDSDRCLDKTTIRVPVK
ncbi:MAG TPA: DUF255 domain-containing protein, partial [Gemmataceae bacterium]|nr:DUF255 domain-containing protein [Gemmataceae bacterium]